MRVGERQIDGALCLGSSEGQPSINACGVEERKSYVCGSVEVGGGLAFFFRGEEPERVGCCIVDVEVACDQVQVTKVLKGELGGN